MMCEEYKGVDSMKKMIALVTVLVLCAIAVCPVLAAEFVPSISDKNAPEIVPTIDEQGNPVIAIVLENGETVDYVEEDCLVVTPVSGAKTSAEIPDAAEEMLLKVYEALANGSMQLPYEKLGDNIDPENMVIRDLFDASWLCGDHPEAVAPAGVHVQWTFDLGVGKDTKVYAMTYKHDQWNPIVDVVNNGDGTVTCTFEDFCPIAFVTEVGTDVPPSETGDAADVALWTALLAVSAVALVAVLVLRRKFVN